MSFHRELDGMAVQDFGVVEESLQQLEDDAALWSIRYVNTAELIRSACDALVAGADSPALRELAGAFDSAASFEIEELLQRVASDFGFDFHPRHSSAGELAAARVLAGRCVEGLLAPRDLARLMHTLIGHDHEDRRVETLVWMDDQYDLSAYHDETVLQMDNAVLAAARELLRFD
jgi:hypothetical protein